MNEIDTSIVLFLNQYVQQSLLVDQFIVFISGNQLLKGGVFMALLWWGWFRYDHSVEARARLLITLFSCFLAILLGRCLALVLPFRLRPMHEPTLDFVLPHTMDPHMLDGWSSFPSDHAVMFMALSFGIFLISRRLGILAVLYTILVVLMPRVYVGLHYPGDLLVGGLIGLLLARQCDGSQWLRNRACGLLIRAQGRPELFYPVFFIVSYQVADMFKHIRSAVPLFGSMVEHALYQG